MLKRKTNKKSLIYNIALVLIAFATLVSALIIINQKHEQAQKSQVIGEKQTELFFAYQKGEDILYNIDLLGKYGFYNTISAMNKIGGLQSNECGQYNGANMWNKGDASSNSIILECYPVQDDDVSKLTAEFIAIYNVELNKLFDENQFEVNNHEISVKEIQSKGFEDEATTKMMITAKAKDSVVINLLGETIAAKKDNKRYIYAEKYKFMLPSSTTVLSSCYGYYGPAGELNDGISFDVSDGGNVNAAADGTISQVSNDCADGKPCTNAHGNYIVIKHSEDLFTAYTHLSKVSVNVGREIKAGQRIGYSGSTSSEKISPQLGFYVYTDEQDVLRGKGVSPLCYFSENVVGQLKVGIGDYSCQKKYGEKISKQNPNLAQECMNLKNSVGDVKVSAAGLELITDDGSKFNTPVKELLTGTSESNEAVEYQQMTQENIPTENVGYYSIKPSFSLVIDYNFDGYRKAVEFSKLAVLECSKNIDVKQCAIKISNDKFKNAIKAGICKNNDLDLTKSAAQAMQNLPRTINLCYKTDKTPIFGENFDINFALFIPDKRQEQTIT